MPNALFYGSALGELLFSEVTAAMFYELQGYRFGAIPGNACAPADLEIRRPKELVVRMYREHFGDRLVPANVATMPTFHVAGPTNWDGFSGEAPRVRTYASLTNDGATLRVMVVNRSATEVGAVTYQLLGFDPAATARTWAVAGDLIMSTNENVGGPVDAVRIQTREVLIAGSEFVFAGPPHSVTAIEIPRRATVVANDAGPEDTRIDATAATLDAGLGTVDACFGQSRFGCTRPLAIRRARTGVEQQGLQLSRGEHGWLADGHGGSCDRDGGDVGPCLVAAETAPRIEPQACVTQPARRRRGSVGSGVGQTRGSHRRPTRP